MRDGKGGFLTLKNLRVRIFLLSSIRHIHSIFYFSVVNHRKSGGGEKLVGLRWPLRGWEIHLTAVYSSFFLPLLHLFIIIFFYKTKKIMTQHHHHIKVRRVNYSYCNIKQRFCFFFILSFSQSCNLFVCF